MARQNRMEQYRENLVTETNEVEQDQLTAIDKVKIHAKKPTMQDTHYRTSYLMKKELKPRLDAIANYYGRGSRTLFLNEWIEAGILEAEEAIKREQQG